MVPELAVVGAHPLDHVTQRVFLGHQKSRSRRRSTDPFGRLQWEENRSRSRSVYVRTDHPTPITTWTGLFAALPTAWATVVTVRDPPQSNQDAEEADDMSGLEHHWVVARSLPVTSNDGTEATAVVEFLGPPGTSPSPDEPAWVRGDLYRSPFELPE